MRGQRVAAVTIAIACYDQARFLAKAITSCLAQSSPVREIVVIDDGSRDETKAVALQFDQVRYVHQENAGLSAARNTGLALATSPRILFLDADDWLTPIAIGMAMQAFDAHPTPPAFAYGSYQEVGEDGHVLATHHARTRDDVFRDLLGGNFIAMHGTVLYDSELLRAAGGFDTSLRSCEDYDVYLRLARDHPVGVYTEVGACYRRHGASLSRDRVAMIHTLSRVLDRHVKRDGQTPDHLAAARQGKATMIDYYARELLADLRHRRGHAARRTLKSLMRYPGVALQLLGWAIGRRTRAVTITG